MPTIPKKSEHLKAVANAGRVTKRAQTAKQAATRLRPPSWLEGAARRQWRVLAGHLETQRPATNSDREFLTMAAAAWSEWRTERASYLREPLIESANGDRRVNPAARRKEIAYGQYRQALIDLGLRPTEIVVKRPTDGKGNPWAGR